MTFSEAYNLPAPSGERYKVLCGKWERGCLSAVPKDYDVFFMKTKDHEKLVELVWNEEYKIVEVLCSFPVSGEKLKDGNLIHKDYVDSKR